MSLRPLESKKRCVKMTIQFFKENSRVNQLRNALFKLFFKISFLQSLQFFSMDGRKVFGTLGITSKNYNSTLLIGRRKRDHS